MSFLGHLDHTLFLFGQSRFDVLHEFPLLSHVIRGNLLEGLSGIESEREEEEEEESLTG